MHEQEQLDMLDETESYVYTDTELLAIQWWKDSVKDLILRIKANISSLERIKFMFQAIEFRRTRMKNSQMTRKENVDT